MQWFAVVCGGLPATSPVSLTDSGGDVWWFAGLRWFAVICRGLSFRNLVIPESILYYTMLIVLNKFNSKFNSMNH